MQYIALWGALMQPDQAKAVIQQTLADVKAHLAQDAAPKLSEADTKAHFIEPIISALGWRGIGVVIREYYVKNSQEFIDFVMQGSNGPLLAIEAKALQAKLSDKHAAQLIQYCAVEGIEWAALTNGRELQFFNAYLKGDLSAKCVLRLDLLAFNSAAEFDALFELLWQLSRASMTTPQGVHRWLNQRRMDTAMRAVISDAHSPTVRALRKALSDAEIPATPQDITQWFASRLDMAVTPLPSPRPPEDDAIPDTTTERSESTSLRRMRRTANQDVANAKPSRARPRRYGVRILDLIAAGVLPPDAHLVLLKGKQVIASAVANGAGEIVHTGHAYQSPSDKTFVALMGYQTMNGWQHWHAELTEGRVSLLALRARMTSVSDRNQ
jgi:hypothetical protein